MFGATETSMMMAAFPDCVRIDTFPEAFGPKDVDSPDHVTFACLQISQRSNSVQSDG